tara:strand:+ start:10483 stop:11067 length:585 start_codon:yes stop_codon:yes gene_type:complete
MKNKISELKKKQRHKFSILRKNIHNNSVYDFNYKTLDDLFEINDFKKINIISSFFSIKTEISTLLLNKYLFKLKKKIVLPTIEFQSRILVFREYKINERLKIGKYNIPEPSNKNNKYLPELLFVPCLAFDKKGYRLGYGGGYYDTTFAHFKKINHNCISIGLAYDDQKVDEVVREKFDCKLDYVLTEKQLYSFL